MDLLLVLVVNMVLFLMELLVVLLIKKMQVSMRGIILEKVHMMAGFI